MREEAAPRSAWPVVLLGLALFGCGAVSDGETASTVTDYEEGTSTSVSDGASVTDVTSAGCMTYAAPGCSSTYDDGWPSDDETTNTSPDWPSDESTTTAESSSSDTTSGTDASSSSDTSGGTDASSSDEGGSESTTHAHD